MTDNPGLSRRTLAKGAAWAAPAIAVAAAAPAMAKSGRKPTITIGLGCKQPGNSCQNVIGSFGYTFAVTITNTSSRDVYLYTGIAASGSTLYDPEFAITYISDTGKTFFYRNAKQVTFAGSVPSVPFGPLNGLISDPGDTILIPKQVGATPGTATIIVDAGTNSNSSQLAVRGSLYFAWGHTATAGSDPDHPYSPKPTAEGWTGGAFNFTSFTSCNDNKYYDCVPFLK